jgi:hypothetical protein
MLFFLIKGNSDYKFFGVDLLLLEITNVIISEVYTIGNRQLEIQIHR